eukprot:Partr_v1_DN28743_c1_g1_i1_m63036 putative zinc finger
MVGYPEPDASNVKYCKMLAEKYVAAKTAVRGSDIARAPSEQFLNPTLPDEYPMTQSPLSPNRISSTEQRPDIEQEFDIKDFLSGDNLPEEFQGKLLSTFGDIPRRYCDICKVNQPIRSKHCYQSGQCILRYDHYCGFLALPVGQNNHLVFWQFLFLQSLAILFGILIVCVLELAVSGTYITEECIRVVTCSI